MSGGMGQFGQPEAGPLVVLHTPDEEVAALALGTFVLFDLVSKMVGTTDAQLRRRYARQVVAQLEYLAGEAWDVQSWAEVMALDPGGPGDQPSAGSSTGGTDQAPGGAL